MYPALAEKIESFVRSDLRNLWIDECGLRLYVRKSRRLIDGDLRRCVDIANIESVDETKSRFIPFLLSELPRICIRTGFDYFLFENVMVAELAEFLRRRGGFLASRSGGDDQGCMTLFFRVS